MLMNKGPPGDLGDHASWSLVHQREVYADDGWFAESHVFQSAHCRPDLVVA